MVAVSQHEQSICVRSLPVTHKCYLQNTDALCDSEVDDDDAIDDRVCRRA